MIRIRTNISFDANCAFNAEMLCNFWPITDTSDARRTRLLQNSIPIHLIRLRMHASLSLSTCYTLGFVSTVQRMILFTHLFP